MLILITEPNHIHCDRIGWVTMSDYGFLTVILHTCETKTFVHISKVTKVGENLFGEIEDGDDSMKDNEGSVRSCVSMCDDDGRIKVYEEGKPLFYHDMYDSDDNLRASDDDYTYETEYHPGNEEIFVNENGEPFGYHENFDSDGKPIRKFASESSESESSKSDTSKKN